MSGVERALLKRERWKKVQCNFDKEQRFKLPLEGNLSTEWTKNCVNGSVICYPNGKNSLNVSI